MRPATREPCPRGRPLFRCGRSHVSARACWALRLQIRDVCPVRPEKGGGGMGLAGLGWDSVGRVGVGLSGLAMVEGGGDWGVGMHTCTRAMALYARCVAHVPGCMHTRAHGFVCTMRCTCTRRACDCFVCSTHALHTCKGIHGPCFFWGWGMVGQGAHCVGVCERKRALSER